MTSVDPRELLNGALVLAARGLRVFPCAPGRKTPLTQNGLHDATTDPAEIRRRWSSRATANVAVRTGDGLMVLDVDGDEGADSLAALEDEYGQLPPTVSVKTGNGQHFYFRCDGEVPNSAGRVGDRLDVRGDGGYVIAPPSRHPGGGMYEWDGDPDEVAMAWAPEWLVNLARGPQSRSGGGSPDGDIIPEGQRNNTLTSLAGSMRRRGMGVTAMAAALKVTNTERCVPPLPEEEVERIAASVARYAPALALPAIERSPQAAPERIPRFSRFPAAPWPTLDSAARYGLAGEIVATIEPHTEADPVALLAQFLAAFGSAVGRGPGFRAEADHHGTNLFVLIVGVTAKGRKGTSWGYIRRLLGIADPDWARRCLASGLSSGEGLIWEVRDPITKRVRSRKSKTTASSAEYVDEITDPGVEDKRLLVQEGEFAQALKMLAREGNTLSPVMRDAWDGRDLRTLTKNSPARSTGPHIAIVGHITQDELVRYLSETESTNGFANRFVPICVERSKVLPDGGNLAEEDLELLARAVREALRSASVQEELHRDEGARALWHEVYPELSEGRPGLLGAVTARAEAQVMRLATLYALLDLSDCIRREHLVAALALWQYSEDSSRYIFGDALADPIAEQLLDALCMAGAHGMTRSELRDRLARHTSSKRLSGALTTLLEHGLARCARQETGGRPAERWSATDQGHAKSAKSAKSAVEPAA